MNSLDNLKKTMRKTLGRITLAATLGAIAIASTPVHAEQASGISDTLYRTGGSQVFTQNQAGLVKAEFSVGINFGHKFGHSRFGHRKYYDHSTKYYRGGNKFRGSFNNGHRRFSNRFHSNGRRGFSNRFRSGGRRGFSNRGFTNRSFSSRGFRARR